MVRLSITNKTIGTIILAAVSLYLLVPVKAQEVQLGELNQNAQVVPEPTHAQEYAARAQYDQNQLQTYVEALQPYAAKLSEQDKGIAAIKTKLAQTKGKSASSQALQKQLNEQSAERTVTQKYVQQLQGYINTQQHLIAEDNSIIQQSSISDTAEDAYQAAIQEQNNLAQLSPNHQPIVDDEDYGNGYYGGYGHYRYGYSGYGYRAYGGGTHTVHSGGHSGSHGGSGRR
jgi:hypothetical protein